MSKTNKSSDMPINPVATASLTFVQENLMDFNSAKPGQWFIGVVDTQGRAVYIVPVNVFEGSGGELNEQTLTNAGPRVMNRYASGTEEDRRGEQKNFRSFQPTNWLEGRGKTITHHAAVVKRYGANMEDCLGFTLIKLATSGFAQMKCSSNSLNSSPTAPRNYNFSQATFSKGVDTAGSAQMPPVWVSAVADYLRGTPYGIVNLAISND